LKPKNPKGEKVVKDLYNNFLNSSLSKFYAKDVEIIIKDE